MSDQIAPTLEQPLKRPARRRVNRADSFGGGLPLAVVAILVTLGGFWPTFFSRLDEVDAAHMLHGMLATGWLVLVLVQASLIGIRKPRWHRVLGWLSLPWFVLLGAGIATIFFNSAVRRLTMSGCLAWRLCRSPSSTLIS